MNLIFFLRGFTQVEDVLTLSVLTLSIILIVSTIDWLFGWLNARMNKNVGFVSHVALHGIVKKMMYFITLIIFMIVSLLILPEAIAYTSIITLFTGYLISELHSITGHLGITDDSKKNELFIDYLKKILSKEEKND